MSNDDERSPQQGDGDSSNFKNYVGLIPFLGLAAYRYLWVRHTEKEIEKIKIKYTMDLEEKEKAQKMKDQEQLALMALNKVQDKLVERQYVYCSPFTSRKRRLEIEDDLYKMAKNPIFANLNMEHGLSEILKNDHHCAERFNRDDQKNGKIMWVYLKQWEHQLIPQTHQTPVGNFKKFLSKLNP